MEAAARTPYPERADRKQSRLDEILLNVWGRASPYLLSALERTQLDRLVQRAEDDEKRLAVLTDQRLRQTADELRSSPLLRRGNVDELALAFAVAREATRRQRGMRHRPAAVLRAVADQPELLPHAAQDRRSVRARFRRCAC